MKKLYTALMALGVALSTNAQTWILTNTGATQNLYTCEIAAKSQTDFYAWIAGEGHTANSRKFANGAWSEWNDLSIGSPVINEVNLIGFSQNGDPYIAYAFDAKAYFFADALYVNATPQATGERILTYALYQTAGGFAGSSTGKVYYPFSSTGNSNLNIAELQVSNSAIVDIKISNSLGRGIAVSRGGDIYILTGGNPIVSTAPASFTKTKGLKALGTDNLDTYVAVGDTGTIHRSVDGGNTWTVVSSGTTQNLNGVVVKNDMEFTVVGNNGTVRKTTNGGATWTVISVPTTEHLNDIKDFGFFGVIVGDNGTVLSYGLGAVASTPCDVDLSSSATTFPASAGASCDGSVEFGAYTTVGGQPVTLAGLIKFEYISGPSSFTATQRGDTAKNLCAGTYTAVAIPYDKNGNEITCRDTFSFTIGTTRPCTTPQVPDLTLVGDTVFASTVGVTGGYDWFKDGMPVATTNFPTNWIRGYGNGTYTAQAGNGSCVSALSAPLVVNLVGINEVASFNVALYPNPATDEISISSTEEIEVVEVYNLIGEKVIVIDGQSTKVNISKLQAGTYLLQVKSKYAIGKKTFIKN